MSGDNKISHSLRTVYTGLIVPSSGLLRMLTQTERTVNSFFEQTQASSSHVDTIDSLVTDGYFSNVGGAFLILIESYNLIRRFQEAVGVVKHSVLEEDLSHQILRLVNRLALKRAGGQKNHIFEVNQAHLLQQLSLRAQQKRVTQSDTEEESAPLIIRDPFSAGENDGENEEEKFLISEMNRLHQELLEHAQKHQREERILRIVSLVVSSFLATRAILGGTPLMAMSLGASFALPALALSMAVGVALSAIDLYKIRRDMQDNERVQASILQSMIVLTDPVSSVKLSEAEKIDELSHLLEQYAMRKDQHQILALKASHKKSNIVVFSTLAIICSVAAGLIVSGAFPPVGAFMLAITFLCIGVQFWRQKQMAAQQTALKKNLMTTIEYNPESSVGKSGEVGVAQTAQFRSKLHRLEFIEKEFKDFPDIYEKLIKQGQQDFYKQYPDGQSLSVILAGHVESLEENFIKIQGLLKPHSNITIGDLIEQDENFKQTIHEIVVALMAIKQAQKLFPKDSDTKAVRSIAHLLKDEACQHQAFHSGSENNVDSNKVLKFLDGCLFPGAASGRASSKKIGSHSLVKQHRMIQKRIVNATTWRGFFRALHHGGTRKDRHNHHHSKQSRGPLAH